MINIKTTQKSNITEILGDWNVGSNLFTKEIKLFGIKLWETYRDESVDVKPEIKTKNNKVGFKNEK
jgi:hypothetical protein